MIPVGAPQRRDHRPTSVAESGRRSARAARRPSTPAVPSRKVSADTDTEKVKAALQKLCGMLGLDPKCPGMIDALKHARKSGRWKGSGSAMERAAMLVRMSVPKGRVLTVKDALYERIGCDAPCLPVESAVEHALRCIAQQRVAQRATVASA